jgi:hypothetical protein
MKCRVLAKASFAWVAQTPDELDINAGEMLLITDDSDKVIFVPILGLVVSFTKAA